MFLLRLLLFNDFHKRTVLQFERSFFSVTHSGWTVSIQNRMSGYAFGPFRFFPSRFVLTSGTSSYPLTPRLLAVLRYLIENRERVVTKQELLNRIWEGSFIEEGNVGRAVSTLRSMLCDNAESPTYIKTINRVGYRFIHPVLPVMEAEPTTTEYQRSHIQHAFLECQRARWKSRRLFVHRVR